MHLCLPPTIPAYLDHDALASSPRSGGLDMPFTAWQRRRCLMDGAATQDSPSFVADI